MAYAKFPRRPQTCYFTVTLQPFFVILETTSKGLTEYRGRGRSLYHALDRDCVGFDHRTGRVYIREGEIREGTKYGKRSYEYLIE